jgi:hypothetical protein
VIEKLKQNRKLIIGIAAFLVCVLIGFFFFNASDNTSSDAEETEYAIEGQTADGFEDGTYCAEVDYYNPNTGTNNSYTLEVEVQYNEVVKILFGNGGWLDSDHMTPQTLDENGECVITTDRNYEYAIKITGKYCDYPDDINPEEDVDLPRYTFAECTQMLGMSEEEINDCLSSNYSESDVLSESELSSLEEYINNMRAIHEQYQREIGQIRHEQNQLNNQINEGYIQSINRTTAYGALSQIVKIKKRGVNYELEVRGNTECTMGTAQFDENNYDWQLVYVRKSPYEEKYSGYYMRIIN